MVPRDWQDQREWASVQILWEINIQSTLCDWDWVWNVYLVSAPSYWDRAPNTLGISWVIVLRSNFCSNIWFFISIADIELLNFLWNFLDRSLFCSVQWLSVGSPDGFRVEIAHQKGQVRYWLFLKAPITESGEFSWGTNAFTWRVAHPNSMQKLEISTHRTFPARCSLSFVPFTLSWEPSKHFYELYCDQLKYITV